MAITQLAGKGRYNGYTTCVIAQDATTSAAADLEGCAIMGLLIPAIDSANLTFTASNLYAGTYYTVKDKDASTFTIAAATGSLAISSDDLTPLAGYRYVKIVASASQTSAAVTFIFTLKA